VALLPETGSKSAALAPDEDQAVVPRFRELAAVPNELGHDLPGFGTVR
jgi:hypothetical protein